MYRFRLTDGYSHAEEFCASRMPGFQRGILGAFSRFRTQRPGNWPLRLHAWDGEWWVDVRTPKNRPVCLTERVVFADAAALWRDAERSAQAACHVASQIGELVRFLQATPSEVRERRRRKFTLIQGGR